MKTHSKLLIAAVASGVLALTSGYFLHRDSASASNRIKAAQEQPAPGVVTKSALTVTTELPQSTLWSHTLAANGSVVAWQEASVGTELVGVRLSEVRVNVGEAVTRGQVLAVLADETLLAELARARANVAAAEARLNEAALNADSARRLRTTGALSEQRITQYLTAQDTARAELAVAIAALELAQVHLQQTRVVAPDAGVISARTATVGAVLGSGQELFRLIRQGRLEWRAEIAAHEMSTLVPGAAARVQGPDGTSVSGTVRKVAPTVDPQSRLGLIYVDLPAGSTLRAGMFAKGEFDLGSFPVLTVPHSAVLLRDGFSYVFGVDADQHVVQIKVQTGRHQNGRIEVLGLAADAQLVNSGVGFLNDGDVVKVVARSQLLATNQ